MSTELNYQPYLDQLIEKITEEVKDQRVLAVFRAVPRHHFLMQGFYFYDREKRQNNFHSLENTDAETWLDMVYQNEALLIKKFETGAPSSSSQPSLMAVMLEALDIQEGMHVLEIGTGTGYNAALLAELVGKSGRVDSIDNQAQLVERAALVLQDFALDRIHLHSGNGLLGVPEHAPYDRIIGTARYTRVPSPLIDQLAIGGKLLMNIGTSGGLIFLEKTANGISGQFLEQPGFFMALLDGTEKKHHQIIEDIQIEELKSMDFRFYKDLFLPDLAYGFGGDNNILLKGTGGTSTIQFSQEDQIVKAIYDEDDPQAEHALKIVQQWYAIGKPKRSDYLFHVTDDGRQIVSIRNAPEITIEL